MLQCLNISKKKPWIYENALIACTVGQLTRMVNLGSSVEILTNNPRQVMIPDRLFELDIFKFEVYRIVIELEGLPVAVTVHQHSATITSLNN